MAGFGPVQNRWRRKAARLLRGRGFAFDVLLCRDVAPALLTATPSKKNAPAVATLGRVRLGKPMQLGYVSSPKGDACIRIPEPPAERPAARAVRLVPDFPAISFFCATGAELLVAKSGGPRRTVRA
jgi:hypothetical protein